MIMKEARMRSTLVTLGSFGKRIEKNKENTAVILFFSHTYRCKTMDRMSMARLTKQDSVIAEI